MKADTEAVLTIGFAPGTPPGKVAEIILAFDTLHRELTGVPLRNLVARIGEPAP